MKKDPLVSVIIPTCDRQDFFKRAIESVARQDYGNIEVIVVDDNSSDETGNIAVAYKDRFANFIYTRGNERCGAAKSRNRGIKSARGEFIAFLDDDDEWLSNKLKAQVSFLEENRDVMAASCWYIDQRGDERLNVRKPENITYSDLLWENFLGSFSFVIARKEVFGEVGLLDEGLNSSQDWDMWLTISRRYPVSVVPHYLAVYYRHSDDRISSTNINAVYDLDRIYKKHRECMSLGCRMYNARRKFGLWLRSKTLTPIGRKLVKTLKRPRRETTILEYDPVYRRLHRR